MLHNTSYNDNENNGVNYSETKTQIFTIDNKEEIDNIINSVEAMVEDENNLLFMSNTIGVSELCERFSKSTADEVKLQNVVDCIYEYIFAETIKQFQKYDNCIEYIDEEFSICEDWEKQLSEDIAIAVYTTLPTVVEYTCSTYKYHSKVLSIFNSMIEMAYDTLLYDNQFIINEFRSNKDDPDSKLVMEAFNSSKTIKYINSEIMEEKDCGNWCGWSDETQLDCQRNGKVAAYIVKFLTYKIVTDYLKVNINLPEINADKFCSKDLTDEDMQKVFSSVPGDIKTKIVALMYMHVKACFLEPFLKAGEDAIREVY